MAIINETGLLDALMTAFRT